MADPNSTSLTQLRKENEEAEAAAAAAAGSTDDDDQTTDDQNDTDDDAGDQSGGGNDAGGGGKPRENEGGADEDGADDDGDDDGGEETEEWMRGDQDADDDADGDGDGKGAGTITTNDARKMRLKYKGKLQEKDDELAAAREENARLKQQLENGGKPAAKPGAKLVPPNRDDFDSQEDYLEARQDYLFKKHQAEQQSQQHARNLEQRQQQELAKVQTGVDEHYDRAAKLCETSQIKPEKYQAADTRFRQALEDIFPGSGEAVADNLISRIGAGSERVIYKVGIDSAALKELVKRFGEDESGLSAAMYMGELNRSLKPAGKRQSSAPAPAPDAGGDGGKGNGNQAAALRKKYREAHARNDSQGAWEIKSKAKQAKIDTSDW